jgi:hypothetical protein
VRQDLFLVARVSPDQLAAGVAWLARDDHPFETTDPIDFLDSPELQEVYEMYRQTYGKLDPNLNVNMPEALLDFNRWLLMEDDNGHVIAFACFKTTSFGVKLGLTASDGGNAARTALVRTLREALNVEGVFGEVSPPLEAAVEGHVPKVPAQSAGGILGKRVKIHEDGFHYSREITNVGVKTKLVVGRPLVQDR